MTAKTNSVPLPTIDINLPATSILRAAISSWLSDRRCHRRQNPIWFARRSFLGRGALGNLVAVFWNLGRPCLAGEAKTAFASLTHGGAERHSRGAEWLSE
jgi:hypothetical protein